MFKRLLVLVISFIAVAQFVFAAVNINTADVATLSTLPNIGAKKAQTIIDYRTANGPFKSVEDLANVKGIKGKTLDKIRAEVSVSGTSTVSAPAPAAAKAAPATAKDAPTQLPAPKSSTPATSKAVDALKNAATK